jgi:hypothetical protein
MMPETMKQNLQKLRVQINFWESHDIIALCWAFYCVNNNKDVDVKYLQIMHCIFCYNNLVAISNPKT